MNSQHNPMKSLSVHGHLLLYNAYSYLFLESFHPSNAQQPEFLLWVWKSPSLVFALYSVDYSCPIAKLQIVPQIHPL
jgi:hypothetical protein